MRAVVLRQAARPTAAALPWSPVLLAGTVLVAAALLTRVVSDRPGSLAIFAGAALASSALAALHDPADRLLAPLPTPRITRRLLRLGLVAIVAVPLLLLVDRLEAGSRDVWATSVALLSTGLAVATWLPGGRGVLVGAAVPVTWAGATRLLEDAAGPLDLWSRHPWPLAALAALVVLAGRHR